MYIYPGVHHSQHGWRPPIDSQPISLVNPLVARLQNPSFQPYCPLRTRRARSGSIVPRHLRRQVTMEEDWLQNFSDIEDINYFNSPVLQGKTDAFKTYAASAKFIPNESNPTVDAVNALSMSRLGQEITFDSDFELPKVGTGCSSSDDAALDLDGPPQPAGYLGRQSTPPTSGLPMIVNMREVHNHVPLTYPIKMASAALLSEQAFKDIDAMPQIFPSSAPTRLDVSDSGLPAQLEHHPEKHCFDQSNWVSQWCRDSASSPDAHQTWYHLPLTPTSMASKASGDDASSIVSGGNFSLPPASYQASTSRASSLSMFPLEESGAQTTHPRHKLPTAPTSIPSSVAIPAATKTTAKRSRSEPPEYDSESEEEDFEPKQEYGSRLLRKRPRIEVPLPSFARTSRDEFLIKAREAGMSYKEIKIQGRFSEAESTLRGRYRTLTKDKDDRVRKPYWTDCDINLLKDCVRRICRGRDPCSVKIPWKKVADYIVEHGGSYHFGNATCRKKWDEIVEEEGV